MVGQAIGKATARRMQQQARRLDRVAGDCHAVGALEALALAFEIGHAGAPPRLVDLDPRSHATGTDLRAVLERVGNMRDQGRGLGAHLAALQAEPAVDAVGAVPEGAVGDSHRPDPHLDAQAARSLPPLERARPDRMRGVRVAVRVSPGPVLAGNRELALEALVVGSQLPVGNGPVGAHAVEAFNLEVGGVEAGRVAGVVGH